jgi:hypothetical protein
MEHLEPARRLIVNADDFGRSTSINQAVIRAHQEVFYHRQPDGE